MSDETLPRSPLNLARIRPIGVFEAADATTRRRLEAVSTARVFEPAATIWSNAETKVAIIQSGRSKLQVMLQSGQTTTLKFNKPGDMVGQLEPKASGEFVTACVAISVVSAIIISQDAMQEAFDTDQGLRLAMLERNSKETTELRQRVFEMANLSVRARVASYLLHANDPADERLDIKTNLTHEEIASLIGSNREAVTRVLRSLDGQDIIRYSRQKIEILNLAGLKAIIAQS